MVAVVNKMVEFEVEVGTWVVVVDIWVAGVEVGT